jgi:hypothetical protein
MRLLPLVVLIGAGGLQAVPPAPPLAEGGAARIGEGDPAECYTSDRYHVAAREGAGGLGTNFLVRELPHPSAPLPCAYVPDEASWEIPNEWAEYFFALEGAFLLLDSGTGPETRGLVIWDLDARRVVFRDAYADLSMPDPDTVAYWSETPAPPDDALCPDRHTWEARGLGTAVEEVRLSLEDLTRRPTGATRCSPRQ